MSHFSVMVRLPALAGQDLDQALKQALAPYNEQDDHDSPFMQFEDDEDGYRAEWEGEEKRIPVVLLDGRIIGTKYDRKFKNPDYSFTRDRGPGNEEYAYPPGSVMAEARPCEAYGSFEQFVAGWHGIAKRDEQHGRYGHYFNPQARWDWWQVGGRFGNQLVDVQTGNRTSCCAIDQLDWAWAKQHLVKKTDEFIAWWRELIVTGQDPQKDQFYGHRNTALSCGLLSCLNEDEIPQGDDRLRVRWQRELKPGVPRYDVYETGRTKQEVRRAFAQLNHPFRTYAFLDQQRGWCQPGAMGWWGHSSATPDSRAQYADKWREWLHQGDQTDLVCVVDCHI